MWNDAQAHRDLVRGVARLDVLPGAQALPGLDQRAGVVADEARREQRALARGVVAAGDGVPDAERRAQARMIPLDRRARRLRERRDGHREALAHLVVETDVAEVGGGGHAQAGEVAGLARRRGVVEAERGQAERIVRIRPGHRGQREAALGDAARERAEVRQQQPAGAVGVRAARARRSA